ncbi:mitochondrial import inner membrane translocase subunit Tim13-like isoform X2 [Telopea speciosissima]|uniref:mitochondrial import inner membrane translocase subunit Tim13-like isoform X2 n=1 Tax=Telopea speciosissima TaxID=54955 RepID=UPI001CC62AC6|nr:mitochondrial import inner membrane translocase subunit Tim13-like isoform X2 [Telopea speciosissima]
MDPFSSPSSGSSSQPSTEAIMDQLKTQLAQAYMEEFVEEDDSMRLATCGAVLVLNSCIDDPIACRTNSLLLYYVEASFVYP